MWYINPDNDINMFLFQLWSAQKRKCISSGIEQSTWHNTPCSASHHVQDFCNTSGWCSIWELVCWMQADGHSVWTIPWMLVWNPLIQVSEPLPCYERIVWTAWRDVLMTLLEKVCHQCVVESQTHSPPVYSVPLLKYSPVFIQFLPSSDRYVHMLSGQCGSVSKSAVLTPPGMWEGCGCPVEWISHW